MKYFIEKDGRTIKVTEKNACEYCLHEENGTCSEERHETCMRTVCAPCLFESRKGYVIKR